MTSIVAITQRVVVDSKTQERRDCLDQNWAPFLEKLGHQASPVPNGLKDPVNWFRKQNINSLILSGGNDLSHLANARDASIERDSTEIALVKYCLQGKLPVIGVCRGLQMINYIFGGVQKPCNGHAGSRHALHMAPGVDEIWHQESVNSFHDWCIPKEDLASNLEALCFTNDGLVEAFKVKGESVWAMMWHPEREEPLREIDIKLFQKLLGK